ERGIAKGGICTIRNIATFARDKFDGSLRHGSDLQGKNAMPIGAGSQVEFRYKDLNIGQWLLTLIRDHPRYSLQHFRRRWRARETFPYFGRQNECYGDEAKQGHQEDRPRLPFF